VYFDKEGGAKRTVQRMDGSLVLLGPLWSSGDRPAMAIDRETTQTSTYVRTWTRSLGVSATARGKLWNIQRGDGGGDAAVQAAIMGAAGLILLQTCSLFDKNDFLGPRQPCLYGCVQTKVAQLSQ
jgi:uncharacterized protein GlcG (DUF336 family)